MTDNEAMDLLGQIDDVARMHDSFDYGLPLFHVESAAKMAALVKEAFAEHLKSILSEGS